MPASTARPRETIETMRALARETKAHGWWHSYGEAIKDWFKLYVGLEAAATRSVTTRPTSFRACCRPSST